MDLFSIVHALIELIGAIDAHSTSPKNLARSLKVLRDKLTSTRGLLVELEELVKMETCDITPSPSHSTLANSSQSGPTLQLIKDKGQLQVLQTTLDDISTWLDASRLQSKSKLKRILVPINSSQDDQKKVDGFLVELESCKLTANLVLSLAMRYEYEAVEQQS